MCLFLQQDSHYAECHYAECHYAECHYAECRGTNFLVSSHLSWKTDKSTFLTFFGSKRFTSKEKWLVRMSFGQIV
jgi:hypothetical protein